MTGVFRVSSALRACAASIALALISLSPANALDGKVLQDTDMHIGPAGDFPIVGMVPADTAVLVNGCTFGEGYCAVRHDGRHGWIPSASVDLKGITRSTNRMANSVVVLDLIGERVECGVAIIQGLPACGCCWIKVIAAVRIQSQLGSTRKRSERSGRIRNAIHLSDVESRVWRGH